VHGAGIFTDKTASTDDKNANKICELKIHEQKLCNMHIGVDGTVV